jgi:hypothetical protein
MFKVLILQTGHSLSDERTEYLIKDRLSFMRFLGLGLSDTVPDANTIWTFREALTKARIDGAAAAAAKAGFSTATGCRIENGRKHPPKTQGRSSLGGVCEFGWFSEQARTPPFIYNLRGALWNKCN